MDVRSSSPIPKALVTNKRLLLVATFAIAIAILVVLYARIDLAVTFSQLRRIGLTGAAVVLLDMTVALLGPLLAWHVLMRADGIRIAFGTTLTSSLMGHSVNLISPMMYFGGEGVRTFHVARVTGTSRRRVLATIVAAEFQQLTALCATIVAALVIVAGSSRPNGMPVSWMVGGTLSLVLIVGFIMCALLLDLRLLPRTVDLLMRCGIFPHRLARVREAAADVEQVVRNLLVRHTLPFLVAQLLVFLSPLAQFVLPSIFFSFLGEPQPTLAQLSSVFVLVQLLFMFPTTPAGLGVYEGGLVGIFRLHGWAVPDGAAYAILVRLDDVLFSIVGAVLLARFGLTNFLKGEGEAIA
jgi:uncharacterized protein (TIRG00374 family)